MRGGFLVDGVRPDHLSALDIADRDTRLFPRMPVAKDDFFRCPSLLGFGSTAYFVVCLITTGHKFHRNFFLGDCILQKCVEAVRDRRHKYLGPARNLFGRWGVLSVLRLCSENSNDHQNDHHPRTASAIRHESPSLSLSLLMTITHSI